MTKANRPAPRGQILIVAGAAMVVLLGITALVVDIGFAWMLRRQEQNAVDPAALAAARWIDDVTGATINMPQAEAAACFYAHQADFFGGPSSTAPCVPANDPGGATLTVKFPPDATAPTEYFNASGTVQVIITRQQQTFFSSIFGWNSVGVQEQAIAQRQRENNNTHSMVSLAPTGCDTARVHGTGSIYVFEAPGVPAGSGGFVQVNSDCQGNISDDTCTTSGGQGALDIDGSAFLHAPKVNVHGSCKGDSSSPDGILNEGASQIGDPLGGIVPPRIDPALARGCGTGGPPTAPTGNAARGCDSSGPGRHWEFSDPALCPGLPPSHDCVHLQPGVYYGGWDIGSKLRVVLAPGIYIIAGGGIQLSGVDPSLDSIQAGGGSPAPVMIFNTDNPDAGCTAAYCDQADLSLTASGSLQLSGLLRDQPCPPTTSTGGCPYGGIVIWYDGDGSQGYNGLITASGDTELFLSGTIYAPKAHVNIEGNAATNTNGADCLSGTATQVAAVQIISWSWDVGGTGDLCMPYDPSKLFLFLGQGLVH